MHKKNMRMGISLLLSFFLAAAIFLIYASAVLKTGFLPGNAWESCLRGSGYGSRISKETEEKLTELLAAYGLPPEVAGELISRETLYMAYSRWLEECWGAAKGNLQNRKESGGQKPQRESFEEQLEAQIMDYLADYQVKMTEQLEQEIHILTAEAGGIYESRLNPQWLLKMIELEDKYQGILIGAGAAGIAAAVFCICLLWRLHHYKHRAIRFVCYAAEASFAWSAGLLVLLGRKEWIAKSGVGPPAYQELMEGLTDIGVRTGVLFLAVEGLFLILLFLWMRRLKRGTQ